MISDPYRELGTALYSFDNSHGCAFCERWPSLTGMY